VTEATDLNTEERSQRSERRARGRVRRAALCRPAQRPVPDGPV